jgi:hypothetical protein
MRAIEWPGPVFSSIRNNSAELRYNSADQLQNSSKCEYLLKSAIAILLFLADFNFSEMQQYLKISLLCLLFFAQGQAFSQTRTVPNSFVILNNNDAQKTAFYTQAIEAADMEQYRLRDKRVRLTFENGFEAELYSAKELFLNGSAIHISSYPVSHGQGQLPVFAVLPSGQLTAKVFTQEKK